MQVYSMYVNTQTSLLLNVTRKLDEEVGSIANINPPIVKVFTLKFPATFTLLSKSTVLCFNDVIADVIAFVV